MKKIFVSALISIMTFSLLTVLPWSAKADEEAEITPAPVNIHLDIEGPTSTIYKQDLTVPACTTRNNPTPTVNAFCAFEAAGLTVDVTWFSFGAQVNSIDSTAGDSNNFWLWFLNGDGALVGIDSYLLKPNDTILWSLARQPLKISLSSTSPTVGSPTTVTVSGFDPMKFDFEPLSGATILGTGASVNPVTDDKGQVSITPTSVTPLTISATADGFLPSAELTITATALVGGGSSGGGAFLHPTFNLPKALAYLSAQQKADGSFDSSLYTDWAAVAFAAADPGAAKTKLHDYLLTAVPALSSVTDYERHAMALEAAGINPYSGSPIDTITPIVRAFDGNQIGSKDLVSDDIFAIFPLLNAGIPQNDPMFDQIVKNIIAKQKPDGSWDESPDMTGAAILAVGPFFNTPGYASSEGKAVGYLLSTQKSDGGWGSSVESTSWIQTAINGIPADPTHVISWKNSAGLLPMDYIATTQQSDGSVQSPTPVWSTAYAVTAASGKSWLTILQSFAKPVPPTGGINLPPTITPTPTPTPTPSGQILGSSTYAEGTLVKTAENKTVYIVKDGKFRPFSSEKIFLAYNFKFSDVQVIGLNVISFDNQSAIMDYPDGTPHE